MATKATIDHIKKGGVVYEFVDSDARNGVNNLSNRVTKLNDEEKEAIAAEKNRAQLAEQALEGSKVTKEEGKGLSTNDFDDTYKDMLDHPAAMTGATASKDGKQGDVPAPQAGEEGKFLQGDGTWATPHDTTYDDVTHDAHGLMTAADKIKLDAMDQDTDDTVSCETVFGSGTITETLGNGKVKTTTFNNDGSITQVIVKTGADTITLTTVFNADGSITRTRT